MFEGITSSLRNALSFLQAGRLTESNIREGMEKVREALLEADVNYDVAQEFVTKVTERAVGGEVLQSLSPTQHIIGIVHQELVQLMGPVDHSLHLQKSDISVIMMCGLQGSGKTTTCGKLARMLKEQGHKPMLVAADLQRPGAVDQLCIVGEQVGVPVYSEAPGASSPLAVCQNGLAKARKEQNVDVVILDTAGRLHIDESLMKELSEIDRRCQPHQVLLVCDAMTGQDAVNSAKAFNQALELDGVILTKLDGDTRGGAALSVKQVTGVPIKFIGIGEQLDRIELFHPDRMAGRILGMGDVVTLFEKAQKEISEDEVLKAQEKMRKGQFTLADFQKQMKMLRKLGPIRDVMKYIPGMGGLADAMGSMQDPEKELRRIDGIINSMTEFERDNPERIDRSRRNRIATGCGVEAAEVSALIKQFTSMADIMKRLSGLGMMDRMKAMNDLTKIGAMHPGAEIQVAKSGTKAPVDMDALREERKRKKKQADRSRKRNR